MRNKVLTKDKLIAVALNIIKEEGLEACTSRNIAKHANCALGTIYNYFESREVFLEEIFNYSWKNTEVKLESILRLDVSVKEKAIKMFRTLNEDVKDRRGLGKFLFGRLSENIDNNCFAYRVLCNGNDILIKLLKESSKNLCFTEEELRVSAKWIYFGVITLNCEEKESELFYQVIIDKFF